MASFVYTPKPKRTASVVSLPTVNSVYTKTVTFDIPAGLATSSIIVLRDFLAAGTEVVGAWAKSSVSQGTSTWALASYTKGTPAADSAYTTGAIANSGAAFVSAVAVTQTAIPQKLTIVPGTAGVNSVVSADGDLGIAIGTAVSVAATVTLTLQIAAIDSAPAGYTTFTV